MSTVIPKFRLSGFVIGLLIVAALLVIFSFCAPYIFTGTSSERLNFKNTGPIGDTIGGLMGPFINLSAVIVTGLAFYMQFKANELQVSIFSSQLEVAKSQFAEEQADAKKQIKRQQFESQFFEMLRLHKENVTEMGVVSILDGGKGEGREAFRIMKEELTYLLVNAGFGTDLTSAEFNAAYDIFFNGYNVEYSRHLSTPSVNLITGQNLVGPGPTVSFLDFMGHSGLLAHYYRHLFMMVKFVTESEVVDDYEEKLKYLKILRAQLSNSEQVLIFYNWVGKYGKKWENDENQFFTEYRMIHNLIKDDLVTYKYVGDQLTFLENKPVKLRKLALFEYQE
ncbi:putative phage abortive infection protein [Chitinophaga rhizosphaerae]|uniref:putative phage abortive infection protein n=1 Tax=Chitinophaga rhizosphaerae TaxID=1864947 RepID=UPI000F8133FE|nr:putative phage abortive infection protein [Chitinophaga rhizosphaerae]